MSSCHFISFTKYNLNDRFVKLSVSDGFFDSIDSDQFDSVNYVFDIVV